MTYTLLDVAEALACRVAEQLDPDSERAADLHRALRGVDAETATTLTLWAEGYTLREISDRLWGTNSPNRARARMRDGLRAVRVRMNGEEQTSK